MTAPPAQSPSPGSGPAQVPHAIVGFTDVSARMRFEPKDARYLYDISATLQESSGLTGVRLESVRVESPPQFWRDFRGLAWDESTEEGCWHKAIRVEAGATLDLFTWNTLFYCAPAMFSTAPLPYVVVTVKFVDDEGHAGTATTSIAIAE